MMGVFASELLEPYAHAMLGLGVTHALVIHGSDGLDEVTTTGETHAMLIRDGKATSMTLHPSDIGLPVANIADLVGGTPMKTRRPCGLFLAAPKMPIATLLFSMQRPLYSGQAM